MPAPKESTGGEKLGLLSLDIVADVRVRPILAQRSLVAPPAVAPHPLPPGTAALVALSCAL